MTQERSSHPSRQKQSLDQAETLNDQEVTLYLRPSKPKMIPVEKGAISSHHHHHHHQENGRLKRERRPLYEDEDATIFEEGQEIMLIEDLHQKKSTSPTAIEEKQTDQAACDTKQRKSTRKVQQVLLVPSSGDLIMERYRQAAQRALKARALLDEALNWDATVPNRDRLAMDAFTEAGKARLLIETEKTPELVAMLSDAKMKGEEEAFRAADNKVSDLIPAVKLPSEAAGAASASAVKDIIMHHYPGLENVPTATATVMMTKDPALQCFQDIFVPELSSSKSGGWDSYEEGDDADEHVYRAKQYLEFILPDLGEVRDDSSMAPKAGDAYSKNLLQKYQQQKLISSESLDESSSSGLGEISSLGFDTSNSFDNLSSQDSEDMFSMSSLNEIMDAPMDDFVPDKIMSIPSMKRKKLMIRMSFGGGKSICKSDNILSTKVSTSEDKESTEAATSPKTPPSEEGQVSNPPPPPESSAGVKPSTKPEKIRKSLSLKLGKRRSTPTSSSHEEGHPIGGLFRRFRSTKKKTENDTSKPEGSNHGPTLRMIGPVLSDLSEGGQSHSVDTSVLEEEGRKNMCGEEKQHNETADKVQAPQAQNNVNESSTTAKEKAEQEQDKGAKCPEPDLQAATAETPSKKNGANLHVVTSKSFGLSTTENFEDRYAVGSRHRTEDLEEEGLKQRPHSSPGSIASIKDMPSRYSPIQIRSDSSDAIFQCGIPSNDDSDHGDNTSACKENSPPIRAKSAVPKASATSKPLVEVSAQLATPKASSTPGSKPPNVSVKDTSTVPSVSSGVSTTAGSTTKKKKKRRSLIGLFNRREGSEDTTDSQGLTSDQAIKKKPSDNSAQAIKPKPSDSSVKQPKLAKTTKEISSNDSKKKQSSLQESLKKTKEAQAPAVTNTSQKKKKKKGNLQTLGRQGSKDQELPLCTTHKVKTSEVKSSQSGKESQKPPTLTIQKKQTPVKSSSLKTALQLTQDTVEIMAAGGSNQGQKNTKEATNQTKKLEATTKKAPQAKAKLGKKGKNDQVITKNNQTQQGRRAQVSNKHQQQEPKKTPSAKKMASPLKSSSNKSRASHTQTTRWVNNFPFSIKRKDLASPPQNALPLEKQKDTKSQEIVLVQQVPPPPKPAQKVKASLPSIVEDPKKLQCDTLTTHTGTISEQSSFASNPLLPFQLLKHLEDQTRFGTEDDLDVKAAAERSIIQSHTRSMHRSIVSDLTSQHDLSTVTTEKENQAASAMHPILEGGGTPISNILSQSPRALCTNDTPLSVSSRARQLRSPPDADGLNARKKEISEILGGLPPASEFGAERSSSFLSRITQGTHRQDHDLPDP